MAPPRNGRSPTRASQRGTATLPDLTARKVGVRSPNDEYRAVIQTWAGGGALSPYCYEAILIVPARVNLANMHDAQSYEVYSGSECDSFADHSSSPEITWDGDRTLKVRISINRTAMSEHTVRLRKRAASGAVSIKFAMDE